MPATMIRGLLVFGLLFLAAGCSKEKAPPKAQTLTYEYHDHESGKEEKVIIHSSDEKAAAEFAAFAERLKKEEVGEVEVEKAPEFLKPVWDLGLWSLVVFLGLLFILSKVAWKPMLEGLKNREDSIAKALSDAEEARKETLALKDRLDAEIKKAQEQARDIVAQAQRDAQRNVEEMIAKAKAENTAERERMYRELSTAKDQALKELFDQSAKLATLIATKAVRRQLNEDDHRRLVDEALDEMRGAAGKFSMN